jgi:hypothetical protein
MTDVTPVLSLLVERLGEAAQAGLRVLVKTFKISTNIIVSVDKIFFLSPIDSFEYLKVPSGQIDLHESCTIG